MKNPLLLLLGPVLLSAALASCQPSPAQQATAAEAAVLARHDSLMARMDQLTFLRQQLGQLPDTVAAARTQAALLAADAAMMDWMHQYRKPADTVAAPRQLAYFAQQQRRIDSVAALFAASTESARALLQAAPAGAGSN